MAVYFTRQRATCALCDGPCAAALVCRAGYVCARCCSDAVAVKIDQEAGRLLAEMEREIAA